MAPLWRNAFWIGNSWTVKAAKCGLCQRGCCDGVDKTCQLYPGRVQLGREERNHPNDKIHWLSLFLMWRAVFSNRCHLYLLEGWGKSGCSLGLRFDQKQIQAGRYPLADRSIALAIPAAFAGDASRRECDATTRRGRNSGLWAQSPCKEARFNERVAQGRVTQPDCFVQGPRIGNRCGAGMRDQGRCGRNRLYRQCRCGTGRDVCGGGAEGDHLRAQVCATGEGRAVTGVWGKGHLDRWNL